VADPTIKLDYTAYRIRIAEYLGVAYYGANGDQAAQLPIDAHDLDNVNRIFHDGYVRFLTEQPWNFLKVPLTITFQSGMVSSDPSRYYLPDDFSGDLISPFTYAASGPQITIVRVTEPELRRLQTANNSSGTATYYALRAINTVAAATGSRWEAIFWPTPSGTETITALYRRFPQALVNATDVSVAGFIHDRTVLAAALAEAEAQKGDSIGPRETIYQRELAKSKKIDLRSNPPKILNYGDKSEQRAFGRPAANYAVDTYNGNSIL
jgi:hypothetical protein